MKKLNNKGFSLVELIIVIAIMAILIGVVGTQVIPYLENSRQAKDKQVLSGFNTAGMSTYTSCAGQLSGNYSYMIHVQNGGAIDVYYRDDTTATTWSDSFSTKASSSTAAECGFAMVDVFKSLSGLTGTSGQIQSQMTSKNGKTITDVKIYIPAKGTIYTQTLPASAKFEDIENK